MEENKKTSIVDLLKDMDAKLAHIEDINADNRAIIIKLVKQSNEIVKFLKETTIEIEEEIIEKIPDLPKDIEPITSNRIKSLKELIDEFLLKRKDLEEFEKELQKNKDKLTPGQVGEA